MFFQQFFSNFSLSNSILTALGKRGRAGPVPKDGRREEDESPSPGKKRKCSHDESSASTVTSSIASDELPLLQVKKNSRKVEECLAKCPSLKGVAIVFRCGNPSNEPCSRWERKTFETASKREDLRSELTGDAAKWFFRKTGVSLTDNVCPPELEERLLVRIVEMIKMREERGKTLRRRGEQPFGMPNCCANREMYLVSEASHARIKKQQGAPFNGIGARSRAAWVMEGQKIVPPGTEVGFHSSSQGFASNGTLMPDISNSPNHSQNLDNPDNKPFRDMWKILQNEFAPLLRNKNKNDTDGFGYDDTLQHLMAVQIILAEKGNGAAGGMRSYHQDGWASTGAAFMGVTLLNNRAFTMRHEGTPKVEVTYPLARRSAYICSGAARYGTLWKDLNLKFEHRVEAFDDG